jgi:hypothetical protein
MIPYYDVIAGSSLVKLGDDGGEILSSVSCDQVRC